MIPILIAVLCSSTPTETIETFLSADRNVPASAAHATANQIVYVAGVTKLDPFVLAGLIDVESGQTWRRTCRGKAHEIGLTQILPSTARACGYNVERLKWDRDYQILCGGYYLGGQKGDIRLKLICYNAGSKRAKKLLEKWLAGEYEKKPGPVAYADLVLKKARVIRGKEAPSP